MYTLFCTYNTVNLPIRTNTNTYTYTYVQYTRIDLSLISSAPEQATYLLRRGLADCPGRLKHPRGITIRALPLAGRDPPTTCRPAKWAAYPSLSTVALDCSFLLTWKGN